MPGALSELIRSLMGSREGVLPSIQAFPPLDIAQIASELHLDVRAKENGKLNQPAPDSDAEDTVEGDILAEIEIRARKAQEDYRSQLDLYNGRIRRALISANQRTSIEAAGESALTDFKVQAINDFNQLYNSSQEVKGREREFDAFRTAHNLVRFPNVVSTGERWVRGLLLAIFVVLESVLNGLFFAKASEAGLIGGVTQAFAFSLLNVGAAVLYGRYGLPCLVHVRPVKMTIGAFISVLYLVWAIGINLLIGHFRDMFIVNPEQLAVTDLLSRLWTAPLFLPADARSLLLVVLGVFLSVISLIDVAGMDDLYPGYGAIGKRRADAISAYADHKARCLDDLTKRRNLVIEDMSRVIKLIQDAEYEIRLAVDGRSRLHDTYRAYLKHLADSYFRLLKRYSEANISARLQAPPARFLKPPAPPDFLIEPPPLELLDLDKDVSAHSIERMEHFIKAVNQQFEGTVRQYQTVVGLTGEEGLPHVHP
jgi:hypothetical protein